MNYKELFELEHKVFPMLFLVWKENIASIIKDFSSYCVGFAPSYQDTDFTVTKDSDALQHIKRYMLPHDIVYCFSFPFQETADYLGLAKYMYVIYNKERYEIHFFLLELSRWHNGEEWLPITYMVEYKSIDDTEQGYSFLRKVYK